MVGAREALAWLDAHAPTLGAGTVKDRMLRDVLRALLDHAGALEERVAELERRNEESMT